MKTRTLTCGARSSVTLKRSVVWAPGSSSGAGRRRRHRRDRWRGVDVQGARHRWAAAAGPVDAARSERAHPGGDRERGWKLGRQRRVAERVLRRSRAAAGVGAGELGQRCAPEPVARVRRRRERSVSMRRVGQVDVVLCAASGRCGCRCCWSRAPRSCACPPRASSRPPAASMACRSKSPLHRLQARTARVDGARRDRRRAHVPAGAAVGVGRRQAVRGGRRRGVDADPLLALLLLGVAGDVLRRYQQMSLTPSGSRTSRPSDGQRRSTPLLIRSRRPSRRPAGPRRGRGRTWLRAANARRRCRRRRLAVSCTSCCPRRRPARAPAASSAASCRRASAPARRGSDVLPARSLTVAVNSCRPSAGTKVLPWPNAHSVEASSSQSG